MSRTLSALPESAYAKHFRRLGFAPSTPSPERRAEAFALILGRADLDVQRLPRVQLVRLLRNLLARDPDLVLDPISTGWVLGFVGRAFAEQEPELHDEVVRRLERRIYRESLDYWAHFPGGSSVPLPTRHQ